ncbi:MAG: peptidase M75 [Bacteroidales bacterium]|jgi:predicted lipoprotein|nr:peptidase M75 [Bacteroidales bacterium]
MKKTFFKNSVLICTSLIMLITIFCSCEKKQTEETDNDMYYKGIIDSYVDNTVIATYRNMADNAIELSVLCKELKANPTDAKVAETCNKWKDARSFWEKSEAFLYGPAEYNSLDPHIDSWPLDKNQLDQVLSQADILTIDGAYARSNFGSSLIGFHSIEYVLFRDGAARQATDISQAELAYLCAIAEVLAEDCILLEGNWCGFNNLSASKKEIIANADLSISSNFGEEMKNAGNPGSRYRSLQQAIFEILEGCKDIADEVGNSKIADPVSSQNVLEVESWYSWNSLSDFVNNINSIENSYLGGINGFQANSLSNFVAQKNQALDEEIKNNINIAKTKILAIGQPFRNNLNNVTGAQEAMTACDNLFNSIEKVYTVIE